MQTIHIKTLEKYHPGYQDRTLIWCKAYFKMLNADPEFEMLCEIDKWRFIALVMLELQTQNPVPWDEKYLKRKGFNFKKRPMSLTIRMLQSFIEVRNGGVTENPENVTQIKKRVEEKREDKILHLDFVFLTKEEHSKLAEKFGATRTADLIEKLNSGIGSKGYKYKSHYFTILNWARREDKENPPTQQISTTKRTAQNRKKIREDYEPYLRAKNTQALKDLRKDKGAVTQIANWLIDEILNERRGTDGATEGNPARKE